MVHINAKIWAFVGRIHRAQILGEASLENGFELREF